MEVEFARVEPRWSSHMLPVLPWPALCVSALGLLTVLPDRDANVVFCRTPVGEEPNLEEESQSQHSAMRPRDEDGGVFLLRSAEGLPLLFKTSPRGPPAEGSHEMGTQLASLRLISPGKTPTPRPMRAGSASPDGLKGESGEIFSWAGEEDEDENPEEAMGMEMESWVLSDRISSTSGQSIVRELDLPLLGQSSKKWRRGFV